MIVDRAFVGLASLDFVGIDAESPLYPLVALSILIHYPSCKKSHKFAVNPQKKPQGCGKSTNTLHVFVKLFVRLEL
jgi:hypothetical protein